MLFNSVEFVLFIPVVFCLYWFCTKGNIKAQNILILGASYFFYGYWDYRFLFLLFFSTLLDYYSGLKIHNTTEKSHRKAWLYISICINLGFLAFFKYYNFFIGSVSEALIRLGFEPNITVLQILLPVGISFYTFHGISYVVDVFNEKIKPSTNLINYSVFVSFFPLLVAGPIERATHLLPQIERARKFDYYKAADGLRQILWGLFKKVVVADLCSQDVNIIFKDPERYTGSTLLVGAFLFSIQIYCDFSGYSDMALGIARLFGFDLIRNFAYPYFSRDIAEFWRRWHISLSSWFKDYVYIPLGGNAGGKWHRIRNTCIIFLLSGFWHGANWTFLFWGALNALFFIPLLLMGKNRNNLEIVAQGRAFPSFREMFNILTTFSLVTFAWIFFRSESISKAFVYINHLFSKSLFTKPEILPFKVLFFISIMFIVEWFARKEAFGLSTLVKMPLIVRWLVYTVIVLVILLWSGIEQQFIYFQF